MFRDESEGGDLWVGTRADCAHQTALFKSDCGRSRFGKSLARVLWCWQRPEILFHLGEIVLGGLESRCLLWLPTFSLLSKFTLDFFFSSFNFLALFHKGRRWRRTTKRTRSVSLFGIASWTSSFSFRSAPEFAQLEMSCTANRKRQKKKSEKWDALKGVWIVGPSICLHNSAASCRPSWFHFEIFKKCPHQFFFSLKNTATRIVAGMCSVLSLLGAQSSRSSAPHTSTNFVCVPSSWFRCCRSVRLVTFEVLTFHFDSRLQSLLHRFQPEKKKIPPASAFKSVRGAMDSLLSLPTLVYSSLESAGQIVGYEEVPTSTDFSLHVHRGHRPVLVP